MSIVPVADDTALSSTCSLATGQVDTALKPSLGTATERFCLRVTPRFLGAVEHLAQTEDLSKADIVRRAVGLYAHARMEEKAGRMIAFVELEPDSTVKVKEIIAVATSPSAAPMPAKLSPAGGAERFELRVTPRFLGAVEHLAQTEDLSKADIVRRAVGLYAHARMEEKAGRMIAFVELEPDNPDNTVKVKEIIRL